MNRYPNIADHGLIGDLQTAALVTTDGTVDWFCVPRFDSPSVFATLLDADHGGYFRVGPDTDDYVTKQLYFPDTAILITRFMTPDGVGEVHDFMPVIEGRATERHRLVRHLHVVRGTMRFVIDIQPAFDYARKPHKLDVTDSGAVFEADGMELTLHAAGLMLDGDGKDPALTIERHGDGLRASRTLKAGQSGGVVLESMGGKPRKVTVAQLDRLERDTADFWRAWVHKSTYTGRWRDMVTRSAITLKLMIYNPSGAPVAAPTTGLPEQVGGERNWDYRYTWIRDSSFSIYALLGLGYIDEARKFGAWMRQRGAEIKPGRDHPLNIMYRVDGSSDLVEEDLDHLEGWRGSRPVRIGNGAADQLQLDIYGEMLDAAYLGDLNGMEIYTEGWTQVSRLIDWLCDHWDQADEGIWETRGGRKNFTYGRFQSWIAFDRAIRMATHHGRPADLARWTKARDAVYQQILDKGWNSKVGAFTQHYDTTVLDSSLLMMPLQGFIPSQDPMWLSTLDAMDKELVSDSLVYRYNPSASPDGLAGDEGTFSLCTFWYVDALARAGRLDEARLTFEKMHTYANHLGLYSEEISSTGEQLGNFPQAFSHLALISAAINLDHELDYGPMAPSPVAGAVT